MIHGSSSDAVDEFKKAAMWLRNRGIEVPHTLNLIRGSVFARARLVDVVFTGAGGHRWSFAEPNRNIAASDRCLLCHEPLQNFDGTCGEPDRWALPTAAGLVLDDVEEVRPGVFCRGQAGFFEVKPNLS